MTDADAGLRQVILTSLVGLQESIVDALLREVNSVTLTVTGFDDLPETAKYIHLEELLKLLTRAQLRQIQERLRRADAALEQINQRPDRRLQVSESPAVSSSAPIFVVHGRDVAVLHTATRTVERSTGRDVIVLHEQPNVGAAAIIEKFEKHAQAASFAVVLLTGDDEGGLLGGPTQARARQNVVLELGYFFGKLGRDRVSVLLEDGVEPPSDIHGLVYIPLDPAGAWKYKLAKDLEAAGITVDHRKIP